MAGRRVYGGSNMAALLQSEGITREAIEAFLLSGASSGFHGSRSMVSFEDGRGSTPERSFYQQVDLEDAGDDDVDECFHQPGKKRRLTADQVQFLEKSFEMENKLEPERKVQLAKDLGLQPRQVAIWFQNRRARWKTKQLEKDYEVLKSSYNNLKADYENQLKDKEKLKAEVTSLTEKLLLKENAGNSSESHELKKNIMLHQHVQNPNPESAPEAQQTYTPFLVGKQEDISSANSAVFDSDSPHHSDGGRRSPPTPSNRTIQTSLLPRTTASRRCTTSPRLKKAPVTMVGLQWRSRASGSGPLITDLRVSTPLHCGVSMYCFFAFVLLFQVAT